jgi:hypothetical protein
MTIMYGVSGKSLLTCEAVFPPDSGFPLDRCKQGEFLGHPCGVCVGGVGSGRDGI